MIYCVDFDGTLCEHKFPDIGEPIQETINLVKNLKREGHKLIFWSCRNGIYVEKAIEWCKNQGIEFDAINEDLPEIKEQLDSFGGSKSVKVFANYYIDDRNLYIKDKTT